MIAQLQKHEFYKFAKSQKCQLKLFLLNIIVFAEDVK